MTYGNCFDEEVDAPIHGECEAEIHRLEAELEKCAEALPGSLYMDPPDGGNVSVSEQLRRMAMDAARYRNAQQLVLKQRTNGSMTLCCDGVTAAERYLQAQLRELQNTITPNVELTGAAHNETQPKRK